MHLHLDLVGGIAGDMFIAAVLDAFPQFEARAIGAIDAVLGPGEVCCAVTAEGDGLLRGSRFRVALPAGTARDSRPLAIAPTSPLAHAHVTWKSIRERLQNSTLTSGVRSHAIAIFELLAHAEAHVHHIEPERVAFHEVGAWDSIADVVGAAALIDALGNAGWSASAAPLGAGRIHGSHGVLPVPAPATTRLLLGMPTLDDGIGGERVTPTGAAILRHLCPPTPATTLRSDAAVRTLVAAGTGFGKRRLPGMSNHLRVLCFEPQAVSTTTRRLIDVFEFEVDDQSGEELAVGLDRLRAHAAVLDVTQTPLFGKKGRMMAHVRVLAAHGHVNAVVDACFRETTTIGLRHRQVEGIGLARTCADVDVDGVSLRVKMVERPGGRTAKAESDDVLAHRDHARRATLRARAQSAALQNSRSAAQEKHDA